MVQAKASACPSVRPNVGPVGPVGPVGRGHLLKDGTAPAYR